MKIFCAVDLEKPHMPSSDLNLISSTDLSGLAQPVQVIAVTGGKGGVGKTSVSVNLATALAASGKRVVLLDFRHATPWRTSCPASGRWMKFS
jgi:Mrp family chromosome partitioning ATPase